VLWHFFVNVRNILVRAGFVFIDINVFQGRRKSNYLVQLTVKISLIIKKGMSFEGIIGIKMKLNKRLMVM